MRKDQQEQLKNSIRCCISCILPCGALDVIRIVHSNGHVQEIACSIRAADILEAHPKHVLKTPSASASAAVFVVPPNAYLRRGKIYFLIPSVGPTPPPPNKSQPSDHRNCSRSTVSTKSNQKLKVMVESPGNNLYSNGNNHKNSITKLPTRCSSSCSSSSSSPSDSATSASSRSSTARRRHHTKRSMESGSGGNKSGSGRANAVIDSDQYLSELLSEKVVSIGRERRRGRVGVWRPHLESISETLL